MALIGCGRIAASHFGAIAKHTENIELVAVCDTDPAVVKQHADSHGVPGYSHLPELLTTVQPDLVALCTPSGLHPEQTICAARHGVHVMTEKPMATRWQDGVHMVKACDEAGVHLFVVKQNRRNATLQLLKRAVEEKRFGKHPPGPPQRLLDPPPGLLRSGPLARHLGV
jgi:UDP-N-acetyl-2-amino-2-deoxyglucuronate dehydrogenase